MRVGSFDGPAGPYGRAALWRSPEVRAAILRLGMRGVSPNVAVVDTDWVRTGLDDQLRKGRPPTSIVAAQDGSFRLFMERDTLTEMGEKLPKFASQLAVPVSRLAEMLAADWLPHIRVVALPDQLRSIDERATAVRDLDEKDYPAAALAALLSPCILLTHNYRHFHPLGIRDSRQGVNAVFAAIDVTFGEARVQAVATVPAAPAVAIGATVKWAVERFGPIVWVILGLAMVGGVVAYRRQPLERQDEIKRLAGGVVEFIMEEFADASASVQQASELLNTYLVPAPENRTRIAAVLRELATATESMSAQQLSEALDDVARTSVESLRTFLHSNKQSVFQEVRRGSFLLGAPRMIRPRTATGDETTAADSGTHDEPNRSVSFALHSEYQRPA